MDPSDSSSLVENAFDNTQSDDEEDSKNQTGANNNQNEEEEGPTVVEFDFGLLKKRPNSDKTKIYVRNQSGHTITLIVDHDPDKERTTKAAGGGKLSAGYSAVALEGQGSIEKEYAHKHREWRKIVNKQNSIIEHVSRKCYFSLVTEDKGKFRIHSKQRDVKGGRQYTIYSRHIFYEATPLDSMNEVYKYLDDEFPSEGSKPRPSSTISTKQFDDWDPSAIVEWLNTLKLSTNYKEFILENKLSGAAMTTIYKEKLWKESGFRVLGDQIIITGAMKSIFGF